jgi:hypothetical protein
VIDNAIRLDAARLTHKPRVPTLRHDRNVVLAAIPHDGSDLARRARLDDHLAVTAVLIHPVRVERLKVTDGRRAVKRAHQRPAADHLAELGDVLGSRARELWYGGSRTDADGGRGRQHTPRWLYPTKGVRGARDSSSVQVLTRHGE